MKKLLEKTSSKQGLLYLLIIQTLIGGLLGYSLSNLSVVTDGLGILDFEIGYSADTVNRLFAGYGENGMTIYKQVQFIDLFNPAVYSILFSSLLFLFYKSSKYGWFAYLGFLCGGLDYLENGFLYSLSNSYPDINGSIVRISSIVSLTKHSVLYVTIAVFIVGLITWMRNRKK